MTIVLFILGILLLIGGAELLVRGATRLAAALGVPTLIIGLTVVALGTSSPELAVSLQAAFNNQAAITLGNVVGSNIANLLLILGVAGLFGALPVAKQLLRRDVPALTAATILTLVLALDGSLGRIDGAILMIGLLAYMIFTIRGARSGKGPSAVGPEANEAVAENRKAGIATLTLNLAQLAGGLALLIIGASWLVDGAVLFAGALGVSELVIGLTVVAIGTSLPEIATSVIAGLRGERDIAVGNVVGSNLLNLLAVLGLTLVISPEPIPVPASAIRFDIPVMLAVTLLAWPLFYTRHAVTRRESILLTGLYIAYTVYVVLAATASPILQLYSLTFLVLIPILVVMIMIRTLRYYAEQRSAARARNEI
ncbi:MAG: calcium/sodium antiporter [Oscillochloris sp.]|nr:calcium/sodium antiporter [Oscillochloris sp.]